MIKCDKCGNEIEVSDALRKELEAKILLETNTKHQKEIEELKGKQKDLEEKQEKEIENVKKEIKENSRLEAMKEVKKEYDATITSTKEESEAREKQNKDLRTQVADLIKQLREANDTKGKLEIEFQKKLLEEEDKIKQGAKKEAQDELGMRLEQKDKQLADLHKKLQEAQRKAQQGSQQLQGEIQEIKLEDILNQAFVFDDISEVPKGINGADTIQTVKTNFGATCGVIVWESKNTKAWSDKWVTKLKDDTRSLKGDISVLVSAVLPEGMDSFGAYKGIHVCDFQTAVPLAFILRDKIISIKTTQEANKGKETKAEVVYNYLTSNEFKQRIEVLVEYFKARKDEVDKEKAYFMKKWSKEDQNIMKVLQSTAGMYGDLQSLIGAALPKVQYLELSNSEENSDGEVEVA